MPNRLARFLIRQWAWGMTSPQSVQTTASLAAADVQQVTGGCVLPDACAEHFPRLNDLEALGGLGCHGAYPRNMNKELIDVAGLTMIRPSVTSVRVTKLGTPLATTRPIAVLWPHMLLSVAFHSFQSAWEQRVCPSSDVLESSWNSGANQPNLVDQPISRVSGWKRKAVPIAIQWRRSACDRRWRILG